MQVGRKSVSQGLVSLWDQINNIRLPCSDDALNEEPAFPGIPKGKPGSVNRSSLEPEEWDASYAKAILGRDFIGVRETFREIGSYYQDKGWSFVN